MPRETLAERTEQNLLDYIAENQLGVGDKLPTEQELVARLGVGRNTLREALKSLASRNILTIRQGAGCFVSDRQGVASDPLGLRFVEDAHKITRDLMQMRIIIEPPIAALAAQNATEEDVRALELACEQVEADIAAGRSFVEHDRDFHVQLAASTHNTVIARLVPAIGDGVRGFAAAVPPEYTNVVQCHRAILEAVRNHRSVEAEQAMSFHILYNQNRY